MKVSKVRFDEQEFLLDPAQDVDATKEAIVAAARQGADFVEFRTVGYGTISLLVTPNFPVRFEIVERSEEQLDEIESDPPPLDQPYSLDYDF